MVEPPFLKFRLSLLQRLHYMLWKGESQSENKKFSSFVKERLRIHKFAGISTFVHNYVV